MKVDEKIDQEEEDINNGVEDELFIEGQDNDGNGNNIIQPIIVVNGNIIILQDEDENDTFAQLQFEHNQILSEQLEDALDQASLFSISEVLIWEISIPKKEKNRLTNSIYFVFLPSNLNSIKYE